MVLILSTITLGACATTSSSSSSYRAAKGDVQTAFDAGLWDQAAIDNAKLSQDPSATDTIRQMAEYRLALSLYRAGLRVAGVSLFKAIAKQPDHAARADAFRSLLPLALELPLVAGIEAPLLHYSEAMRAEVLEDLPFTVRSRVHYLLSYADYTREAYREAIEQFEQIEGGDLPRAQIMIAMCHVKLRKSVPAVAALSRARKALAFQTADPETRRLVDFVDLFMARIYFSAAARTDKERSVVVVDKPKMTTALRIYKRINAASPFALDALWERAWVELALGDQRAALSDFRSALSTSGAYIPEAELMEASVRWGMGEKDAALESLRSFVKKYSAVQGALLKLTTGLAQSSDPDAATFALLAQAQANPDHISTAIRPVVIHALRQRRMLDSLDYAHMIENEIKLLDSSPEELRVSTAGVKARNALKDEHRALVRRSAVMVRSRLADEAASLQTLIQETETALAIE